MPYLNSELGCCGLREIDGLTDNPNAADNLRELVQQFPDDHRWRHAIFSEACRHSTYGKDFAALITKEKLGTVIKTRALVNPNSGNRLRAYVWTVNWDAVRKYTKRHCPDTAAMWNREEE